MDEYSIPRKIYNFFLKHWLVSVLILTLPSYYLILLTTLGKNLDLVEPSGLISAKGEIIFWPLFFVSITFAILKTYSDKYNEQIKYNGQYVLQKMISSVNAIKTKKLERFNSYIADNHGKNNLDPFDEITQPKRQIASILENIQICLSEIFDINRDDIGLSIIYKFDTLPNAKFRYLHTMNISNDLTLNELTTNP